MTGENKWLQSNLVGHLLMENDKDKVGELLATAVRIVLMTSGCTDSYL